MTGGSRVLEQRRRIAWLAAGFVGVGLVLVGSLVWWQLFPHEEVAGLHLAGGKQPNVIPAARGNIVDATGHRLVATTVKYEMGISPRLLSDAQKERLTPVLAQILGKSPGEVAEILRSDAEYVAIQDKRSADNLLGAEWSAAVGQRIEELELPAFRVEAHFRRLCPDDALAASVLGFVDLGGEAHYGLEEYYDGALRGVDGQWYGLSDSWGRQVLAILGGYRAARDGCDLVVTLDRNIQHAAESMLKQGIDQNGATGGNIVVLDPRTGAILAMANHPTYHPEQYWRVDSTEQFINSAISALYEPGSVFKPMTLAAALEARVIRPSDSYDDRGEIIVGNQRIRNSDGKAHGRTTMTELLAYSRNVGAAHLAALLGPTRFYEMIRKFGFSETTGVDLAFEASGIMRVPGNRYWHMSDVGTNAFGQGISVTPLQMVAAYGAIANDGVLMRPHLVSEIHDGDGVEVRKPFRVRRVVSTEVARQVTELMADAVELGMEQAIVPGYRLAGKSGTSNIAGPEGYERTDIIATFAGFGPVPNPRFVILVKYDRPQVGDWGLEVAAPTFRNMAKFLLDYYVIPPARG